MSHGRFASLALLAALVFGCAHTEEAPDPAVGTPSSDDLADVVVDACAGKRDADECTMQLGGHAIDGSCRAGFDRKLACFPSRPSSASAP